MSYKTILVLDEDDTASGHLISLPEFLDYIYEKMKSQNASPEDIFVRISTREYEADDGYNFEMAQIEFLVNK